MKLTAHVLTLIASVILILVLPCKGTAQEGGVGIIERISGTVFWRQNAAAKSEVLDPKSDAARRLYPGEQVRCARGSSLVIRLGRRPILLRGTGWFPIRAAALSQTEGPVQVMINKYGTIGGADRAGEWAQVFSPSDHSVVEPRRFIIRWAPTVQGCTFYLTIRNIESTIVWRQGNINGASGFLDPGDARQKLTDYQAHGDLGPLTLMVDNSCESQKFVTFSLLSVKNERSLRHDLAFWGKESGMLIYHLGRASVFSRYRMFPQVAEEYESALRTAPRSRDLLKRTILAHCQTGNFTLAMGLKKRLPAGTDVPQCVQ
jgi:hypothetical protein